MAELCGILVGGKNYLKYLSLHEKTIRDLDSIMEIYAFFVDNDEKKVYFGGYPPIIVSSGFISQRRLFTIYSIQKFNNTLLDAGWYGIVDTKENNYLISREKMEEREISEIHQLIPFDNELYALVKYKSRAVGLVEISKDTWDFGKEIFRYDKNPFISRAILVKKDNFSIISNINSFYIDLDGTEIKNTKEDAVISDMTLFDYDKDYVELFYSLFDESGKIIRAKINLEKKEAEEKETILSLPNISAIALISDENIHKCLLE